MARALDEDPDDRRSFERIERILSHQQDWRELARAYRHMIKRLGANPPPDKRPYLMALWRGLAEISRVRLADPAAAAAALEVCVSLAPEDNKQREALVELYEAQGAQGFLPERSSCANSSWQERATPRKPRSRFEPWLDCTARTGTMTVLSARAPRFVR
jgi:hypothetical protein